MVQGESGQQWLIPDDKFQRRYKSGRDKGRRRPSFGIGLRRDEEVVERLYPMWGGTGSPRAHGLITDVSGDPVVPLFVAMLMLSLLHRSGRGLGCADHRGTVSASLAPARRRPPRLNTKLFT